MIRIEDEQFSPLRENINFMLNKTIGDMMETGEIKKTVTAKVGIILARRQVQLTETETRIAFVPEFHFKVTMAKQIREEVEGEVYEDQMEIIADADGNLQYKQMPGARQMSLFDKQ